MDEVAADHLNENELCKEDCVIFVSNSELDGFREGDGDLMDKLVDQINLNGYKAIRVIENQDNIPEDKKNLLAAENVLITLGNRAKEDNRTLQQKFLGHIRGYLSAGKRIIVYIGSRINVTLDAQFQPLLSESGSLFDKEFLAELKTMRIKIVINCLEHKFFKRSLKEFPRFIEQMRQQLCYADAIHFLNEHDKSNFIKTLDDAHRQSEVNENIRLDPHSPFKSENLALEWQQRAFFTSEEIKTLYDKIEKGSFVSGIYTVAPLEDCEIINNDHHYAICDEAIIKKLKERPFNILCFGLIRGEKGIMEAIALSKALGSHPILNATKIIIAGKLMGSFLLFQKMIRELFDLTGAQINQVIRSIILSDGRSINPNQRGVHLDSLEKDFFDGSQDKFNEYCQQLYIVTKQSYNDKGSNCVIKLNINEQQLHEIALDCRYAIKLDHKGMANNASTIVSCFGLYLPTITTVGMLTGQDFKTHPQHRQESSHSKPPFLVKYQLAILARPKQYESHQELVPKKPETDEIIALLEKETDELYVKRLATLRQIKEDGLFKIENVTNELEEKVFRPLWMGHP